MDSQYLGASTAHSLLADSIHTNENEGAESLKLSEENHQEEYVLGV